MDIWSWIIVSTIALIAILSVVDNSMQKKKVNDKIKALYAVIFQTKEYTKFVSTFHDHIGKIKNQLPQMNEVELVKINKSLLRKSWALAAVTNLRIEETFGFIKNNSRTNIAMINEDSQLIDEILRTAYGNDCDKYDIDLYDDSLESIHKILEAETNNISAGNLL